MEENVLKKLFEEYFGYPPDKLMIQRLQIDIEKLSSLPDSNESSIIRDTKEEYIKRIGRLFPSIANFLRSL